MKRLTVLLEGFLAALVMVVAVLAFLERGERAQATVPLAVGSHLIVIPMENKSYAQVVDNPNAPYINSLIPNGRLFTQYYGVVHPSLPDYLVLTGGDYRGCVSDTCPANSIDGENLFHELNGDWKIYAEGMPSNCYLANKGPYLVRHNPAAYYTNLNSTVGDGTCQTRDVPATRLAPDIAANAVPRYAWYVPNQYNDMHSNRNTAPCQLGDAVQNEICQGDQWLSQNLPNVLSDGGRNDVTVLLVVDEGVGSTGGGGQILLLELGAAVTPGQEAAPFNHYGLVNGMADALGVARLAPAVPSL